MRIATWNVNSLGARMPRVEEWLGYAQPDVLLLQETKMTDSAFPAMAFESLGYSAVHYGEGRWNGVAIISKVGIDDPQFGWDIGDEEDPDARIIWATCGGVRVASVYVPNGRSLDDDHYTYKLRWLARLRDKLGRDHSPDEPLLIGGDYNIAPTDEDVWDRRQFEGSTHVTEAERAALDNLKHWGLTDCFRLLHPEPGLYSYWDYRAGMFHKRQGMRIDLLLATESIAKASTFSIVDRQARKGKLPSDHAPVIVDFEAPL